MTTAKRKYHILSKGSPWSETQYVAFCGVTLPNDRFGNFGDDYELNDGLNETVDLHDHYCIRCIDAWYKTGCPRLTSIYGELTPTVMSVV